MREIIEAPFLDGKAKLLRLEECGKSYILEAVLIDDDKYIQRRIDEKQYNNIEKISETPITIKDDSEEFFYNLEANRIRMAYQFDPYLAVSTSKIDPLPHQIKAVYDNALELPKMRFMIADDAGAGKTIMAGLILKELQYRKIAKRILIVSPGHLKYQWQRELEDKFQSTFELVNREVIRSLSGNVWERENQVIASMDFIKQDDIKANLSNVHWDLVIVDEAHKMSAYAHGSSEDRKIEKTKRYQVGEVISRNTDHLLFLTATPHKGDEENFRLFLDLLRPGFFAKREHLKEAVEKDENPLFVRRLKEDMKTFEGEKIFPPRNVKTVQFHLSSEESALYNAVTDYVQNHFDKASENRHIVFAMIILQRRLSSSINAIYESLKSRKEKLKELLELPQKIKQEEEFREIANIDQRELEDMEEERRWEIEEKMEKLTIAQNIEDVKDEISKVDSLIEKAKQVLKLEEESKLRALKEEVLSVLEDRKLLIFTEFKDTLYYLVDKLESWGYEVTTIHGGMGMDKRVEAEKEFKENAQIMVATEAAGEGINLQFCSWMINYDIPWNPNRLEQRMGRIHRYGQEEEVFIWNMITRDTMEGRVLERLFSKLERMREDLGSDKVFDVISDIIPGDDLGQIMQNLLSKQRSMDEIEEDLDNISTEQTKEILDDVYLTNLATRYIDYTKILEKTKRAEENKLVPEYIKDYFLRVFQKFGGNYEKTSREGIYKVKNVPYGVRKHGEDKEFKDEYGEVKKRYNKIAFQKELAKESNSEYISPGHPLLEVTNEAVLEEFSNYENEVAVFKDPTNKKEGVYWFIAGTVKDGTDSIVGRKIFCIFQDQNNNFKEINPAVLWDNEPVKESTEISKQLKNMLEQEGEVDAYITNEILMPYKREIEERRLKRVETKEKYGIRSINTLIQESNQKILDYETRYDEGEDMELALNNERRRLEKLQKRKKELKKEVQLEKNLTVSEPKILGKTVVLPKNEFDNEGEVFEGQEGMTRSDEIEEVGMQVAMQFEKKQNRKPEDVSEDNCGFDVRSIAINEDGTFGDYRYIEVKARARTGSIRLTANEWKKARRYGDDYWLYIVTEASSDNPNLKRVNNPRNKFNLEEDIFATGFKIPEDKWKSEIN